MTEDVIEWYENFNTKGCLEDLSSGKFNDQPILSTNSDLKNDFNKFGTPIDADLADNKEVEYAVVTNE